MNSLRSVMPAVLDQEISDLKQDAFGHRHYSEALRSLVESPMNEPPYSIGLLGPWGTGKSTIKQFYLQSLKDDPKKSNGLRRKDRIKTVTFNAWRFGGEDIKRALLRHVYLQLGGNEELLKQRLFSELRQSKQEKKSAKEFWFEFLNEAFPHISIFIICWFTIITVAIVALVKNWVTGSWAASYILSVAFAAGPFLAKYVFDLKVRIPRYRPFSIVHLPSTTAEQYEDLLIEQLSEFSKSRLGRCCERLVIFVDDLDRLSAAEMVGGLDAIRAFLEMPCEDLGLIFVISCDEDRVADALARGRSQRSEMPGSVFTRMDARRYLDRLFQFRLEIPRFPRRDMRSYGYTKLNELQGLMEDLKERGIDPLKLRDHLIHVGVQSPRNALQILNAFAQTWWLAVTREHEGIGSEVAGALHEGTVTNHPLTLGSICVLRVDFPDFFQRLQEWPNLIDDFVAIVLDHRDIRALAPRAQEILSEFLQRNQEGNLTDEVKPEHRKLRQYLASVSRMRRPKPLDPLLTLAEDAISRRYSGKAGDLMDAFVSGDTQGVLEVFGRSLDKKPLSREDVQMLEDLTENISQDTETHRVNAARVLSEISPRLPDREAAGLMVPLARQMIDIREVRENIGPENAKQVLRFTGGEDRMEVAERFTDDFLRNEGFTEFHKTTGELPNIDELLEMTEHAVELILDVRKDHGLTNQSEAKFISWMRNRHVATEKQATSFPFSMLEKWMKSHDHHLLPSLRETYTDLLIAQFEVEETGDIDLDTAFVRVENVFQELAETGEDSRRPLWAQLARFISVRSEIAIKFAAEMAVQHGRTANAEDASNFLMKLTNRLTNNLDSQDEWPLDHEAIAEILVGLAMRWLDVLSEKAITDFAELVKKWGYIEETSDFALRGFNTLGQSQPDALELILADWTSQTIGELSLKVEVLLATEFGKSFTDSHRATFVQQLDAVVNQGNVKPEIAKRYYQIIKSMPDKAFSEAPLNTHVDIFFTRLVEQHQDQNGYLTKLFIAAVRIIPHTSKGRAGQMLRDLFTNAAGVPNVIIILHTQIANHWPDDIEQTGQYNPQQIFNTAAEIAKNNPNSDGIEKVVLSMRDLINKELVDEKASDRLKQAACSTWQYKPEALLDSYPLIADRLLPDDIVSLMQNPPENERDSMEELLSRLAKDADNQLSLEIITSILEQPPIKVDDETDGALAMWLNALSNLTALRLVTEWLESNEPNDQQGERIVRQCIRLSKSGDYIYFARIVPQILTSANLENSRAAIFDLQTEITNTAKTQDDKGELVKPMVEVFPSIIGATWKQKTAVWIRQLGGQRVIESSSSLGECDLSDLDILAKTFPGSKKIRSMIEFHEREKVKSEKTEKTEKTE